MGNRAVVVFESMPEVGVYLHWNGGPESVLAFLDATRDRGAWSPGSDPTYSLARFVGTVTRFFESSEEPNRHTTAIGVGPVSQLDTDNMDNGTYYVADDWSIARREYGAGPQSVEQLNSSERYQAIYDEIMALRVTK